MTGFLDALTDPGVDALLGMAQGFGQAAMPTRMPTPIGATLGMGVGGALPAVAAGQSLQKSAIENQRAQMLMNWYNQNYGGTGAAPFGAPGGAGGAAGGGAGAAAPNANSMYLRSPQQIAGMGDLAMATGQDRSAATLYGMPNTMAGGAGYAMAPDGTAFAVPNGAADPRVIYAKKLAEATAGVGPAIAQAGGVKAAEAPYVPPQTYDMPNLDATGKPVLDAQGNPTFSKRLMTPVQASAAASGGGVPNAAATSADPFPGWAKQINGGENATGNPAAKNPQSSASGNGQFVDGTWPSVIRAARPDLAAGKTDAQLMALRNDPDVAQQATEIYGRQNAAALAQAGYLVNGATVAMAHGLGPGGAISVLQKTDNTPVAAFMPAATIAKNPFLQNGATVGAVKQHFAQQMGYGGGQQAAAQPQQPAPYQVAGSPVAPPGGVPTPVPAMPGIGGPPVPTAQQQADIDVQAANQKAINEAQASRTKYITTRSGVVDPTQIDPDTGMAKEVYRQPEYHELQEPGSGQEYPAFISPGANGKLSIQGGPPGMAPGQVPPSKLGPGQEDTIKHLADQYAKEDKQKYEGATNSLFQLDQQDKNIAVLNQGSGWSATGAGADAKLQWAKNINSGFQTLNLKPPFDPAKVSTWEDATKIQTQLAFAQAKQLGSREAQQVISMSRAATPGAENTPQGYQRISSGYHEMNNREVDMYGFKTAWLQSHGGNLTGAETAFNNQYTPKMYADRAVSTVEPIKITATDQPTAMAQMAKYLPGTVVTLANGKQTIVPPRQNAPPVPSYIQSYLAPQGAPNAP